MNESKIPKLLQEINDPPKKLYVLGELPTDENIIYLTVVGSRKFTQYGKTVCEKLIAGLSGYPVVIVSGLSLGMDGIAHRAALENILDYFHLLDEVRAQQQQFIALEPREQSVINLLSEPKTRNSLAEELDMTIMKLNILLSSMEIKGLVGENLGKIHKK